MEKETESLTSLSSHITKKNRAGFISFWMALFNILFSIYVYQIPLTKPIPVDIEQMTAYIHRMGILVVILLLISLIGFILGIVGLAKRDVKKRMAVIGLVVNILILFLWSIFIAFGMSAASRY